MKINHLVAFLERADWKMIQTFQVRTSTQTEFIDVTRSVQEAVKKQE
jgi:hypothetical protein